MFFILYDFPKYIG